MNPVPVTPMAALDADLTIAVSAGGERERSVLTGGRGEEPTRQDDHSSAEPRDFPAGLTGFDVMTYSLGMDLHRAEEMISLGRSAAEEALEESD